MTTIATDGKSMAGDTLITSGNEIVGHQAKIFKLKDGRVVGFCGYTGDIAPALRWFEGKRKGRPVLDEKFEALVLRTDGRVEHYGSGLEPAQFIMPQAVGSGSDLAIGAMLAGASPVEAVKIAMERDIRTGGEVTELMLEGKA